MGRYFETNKLDTHINMYIYAHRDLSDHQSSSGTDCVLLWMDRFLHQLVGGKSQYSKLLIPPNRCRICPSTGLANHFERARTVTCRWTCGSTSRWRGLPAGLRSAKWPEDCGCVASCNVCCPFEELQALLQPIFCQGLLNPRFNDSRKTYTLRVATVPINLHLGFCAMLTVLS